MSGITTKILGTYKPEGTWGGGIGDMFQNFYKTGGVTGVTTGPAPTNPTLAAPTADVGGSIPYVLGRRLIDSANVIWVGNLNPIYDTISESTSEDELYYTIDGGGGVLSVNHWQVTKTTVVTTTYVSGYHIDCHIGLCLGPDVKLVGIYYDNKKIWSGSLGPDRATVTIPENDTAISGATVIFHGGAFDQEVDPTVTDEDMPAYVGVAYIIIRHIRADNPLQNLQFEVERYPNKLSLSAANNKYNDDLNVISAIADIVTNGWGGAGVDISEINTTNFSSVASTLASEKNGCSLVSYGDNVKSMVGYLLQQIYGMMYQNPESGKLEVNLVRDEPLEVTPENNFATTNVVALRSFSKTSWTNTLGKINGVYTNRADDYKPGTILVQNLDIDGSKIDNASYPYVMNSDLALDILSRDLGLVSSPLFSLSFEATRQAANLLPGDVVFLSWGEYGLYGVPVVVSKARKLPIDKNTVIVEANQYLIPEITPVYEIPEVPFEPDIVMEPKKPTGVVIISAPYWMARAAGITNGQTSNKVDAPLFLPMPFNNLQSSFDAYSNYNSGMYDYVAYANQSVYPTYGQLSEAIDKYDGWTTGVLTTVVLDGIINSSHLKDIGTAGMARGDLFLIIDDEIMSFEEVSETGAQQYTLYNVRRGLLDTVAQDHSADSPAFIINNNYRNVSKTVFSLPLSSRPNWYVKSNVTNQRGSLQNPDHYLLTDDYAPSISRILAPPRPHDTKVEGVRATEDTRVDIFTGQEFDVTWKTRSRLSQTVRFQTDSAEDSEVLSTGEYQYHQIIVVDGGNTERNAGRTPEDEDVTYNSMTATVPTNSTLGNGFVVVRAKNDFDSGTATSLYDDRIPVRILPGGVLITEDEADYLISEDGNNYLIQE